MNKLIKIVSGGQTGVDQAGLFAAEKAGYQTGGWAPHYWMTSNGPNPSLLQDHFGLAEHSGDYKARTIQNVQDSDATLILATDFKSRGTALTINSAAVQNKPFFNVKLPYDNLLGANIPMLINWLDANDVEVLNIAGNRQTAENNIFQLASEALDRIFASIPKSP